MEGCLFFDKVSTKSIRSKSDDVRARFRMLSLPARPRVSKSGTVNGRCDCFALSPVSYLYNTFLKSRHAISVRVYLMMCPQL